MFVVVIGFLRCWIDSDESKRLLLLHGSSVHLVEVRKGLGEVNLGRLLWILWEKDTHLDTEEEANEAEETKSAEPGDAEGLVEVMKSMVREQFQELK